MSTYDRCKKCRKFIDGCVNLCECPEPPSENDQLRADLKAATAELEQVRERCAAKIEVMQQTIFKLTAERDAWREYAEHAGEYAIEGHVCWRDSCTRECCLEYRRIVNRARKLSEGES